MMKMTTTHATRGRAVRLIWAVLVAATLMSWLLGAEAFGTVVSVLVLVVAFAKVRLIGLCFMEIASAPRVLRIGFELYVVVTLSLLLGVYLVA